MTMGSYFSFVLKTTPILSSFVSSIDTVLLVRELPSISVFVSSTLTAYSPGATKTLLLF